ncbi:type II toxin-antitoxin system Phd/YefM family antitoxin [Nocardiopsis protaetiae]|uniref:type II toxin-antitoxin system Phd/YefM family antitoxin n=1 Tax=Nocardiopsis protaetiae TaxID=3382270 RepID=UPI00387AC41B
MRTITATEAARKFSDLLDAIASGERVVITRGKRPIAEMGPPRRRTGADLSAALEGIEPPDEEFEKSIAEARAFLVPQERDPWDGA